ncbi:hypothetical protein D5086_027173, partial [Populus alba]
TTTTSPKKGSFPVITPCPNTSSLAEVDLPIAVSSPMVASHSGAFHSTAPAETWRDLFASNHNTITGQLGEPSHNYDPMTTKSVVASDGYDIVKRKKGRKSPGILVDVAHTTDHAPLKLSKGKTPVVSSLGDMSITACHPPIIHKEKESVGVVLCRKDPNVVPVGVTTICGQKRSSSRASGSGRVPPTPPLM